MNNSSENMLSILLLLLFYYSSSVCVGMKNEEKEHKAKKVYEDKHNGTVITTIEVQEEHNKLEKQEENIYNYSLLSSL